jgi:hypothetical protein
MFSCVRWLPLLPHGIAGHFKIDKYSFWWGELVFLIWNALNDFVTGWISDSGLLSAGPKAKGCGCCLACVCDTLALHASAGVGWGKWIGAQDAKMAR